LAPTWDGVLSVATRPGAPLAPPSAAALDASFGMPCVRAQAAQKSAHDRPKTQRSRS
jgi:hypothetical protein